MARHPVQRARDPVSGLDLRAPLRGLSCPHAGRDVAAHEPGRPSRRPGWYEALATDYWHPATTGPQGARQRLLAMIVAFVLAAVLAHLGW